MSEKTKRLAEKLNERLGEEYNVLAVNGGIIVDHVQTKMNLVEVDPQKKRVTVTLQAEFSDRPELSREELREAAFEELRPRLRTYQEHGYEVRETDQRPAMKGSDSYDEDNTIPVVVTYLDRHLGDIEELPDEIDWLVEQLPNR